MEIAGASCTVCPDGEKLTEAFENVKPGEYDARTTALRRE